MKINNKLLFSITLILTSILAFACGNDNNSVSKKNIEEFLNKKSELYEKRDEIVEIVNTAPVLPLESEDENLIPDIKWEENYNEILKDIKVLVTEKAYEKLLRNRCFLDKNLIDASMENKYDKAEIKDIEYVKVSEEQEEIVYTVKYIENLYSKGGLKEEKKHENEFTLEKTSGKWLISGIN